MKIVLSAWSSHLPEHRQELRDALVALHRSGHEWLVPDPEDWVTECVERFEFQEFFEKAARAADEPPGSDTRLAVLAVESYAEATPRRWPEPWITVLPKRWYAFLNEPLQIVAEDAGGDGGFLRCVAHGLDRAAICRAFEEKRLRLCHGGGSGLDAELRRRAAELPETRKRIFVLMDSDKLDQAHEPGKRKSAQKYEEKFGVLTHVLERREIENYLPAELLRNHVFNKRHSQDNEQRLRLLFKLWREAFTSAQRAFFDMEKGLHDKSAPQERQLVAVLLEDDVHHGYALHGGFGGTIKDAWYTWANNEPVRFDREWLSNLGETALNELKTICDKIESLL